MRDELELREAEGLRALSVVESGIVNGGHSAETIALHMMMKHQRPIITSHRGISGSNGALLSANIAEY